MPVRLVFAGAAVPVLGVVGVAAWLGFDGDLVDAILAAVAAAMLFAMVLGAARLVAREMRERSRLAAELGGLVELQKQLMAVVGHDLKNPLSTIKTSASLLTRVPELSDDHREDARRILSNARRMERLLRDLLDFSRLRAGQGLPLTPVESDLVQVVRRAVADLGRDAEGRVAVESVGRTAGRFDVDRLEQVAVNLVGNALKYGPPLRPVRVRVEGDEESLRLAVHDEGGAIPAEGREELFEPFRRGVSGDPEARRSSGLGLFIVRRIAERHGGEVEIDSAPERGTTFTVRLPRLRA